MRAKLIVCLLGLLLLRCGGSGSRSASTSAPPNVNVVTAPSGSAPSAPRAGDKVFSVISRHADSEKHVWWYTQPDHMALEVYFADDAAKARWFEALTADAGGKKECDPDVCVWIGPGWKALVIGPGIPMLHIQVWASNAERFAACRALLEPAVAAFVPESQFVGCNVEWNEREGRDTRSVSIRAGDAPPGRPGWTRSRAKGQDAEIVWDYTRAGKAPG